MKLENLKERIADGHTDQLYELAPEILALVEAANRHDYEGMDTDARGLAWVDPGIRAAIEAFNAKLESL